MQESTCVFDAARPVAIQLRGPDGEDFDAALLAKIRTEEEPEVDAFEAQKVIEPGCAQHHSRSTPHPWIRTTGSPFPSM
jgi:hypothetical protein